MGKVISSMGEAHTESWNPHPPMGAPFTKPLPRTPVGKNGLEAPKPWPKDGHTILPKNPGPAVPKNYRPKYTP